MLRHYLFEVTAYCLSENSAVKNHAESLSNQIYDDKNNADHIVVNFKSLKEHLNKELQEPNTAFPQDYIELLEKIHDDLTIYDENYLLLTHMLETWPNDSLSSFPWDRHFHHRNKLLYLAACYKNVYAFSCLLEAGAQFEVIDCCNYFWTFFDTQFLNELSENDHEIFRLTNVYFGKHPEEITRIECLAPGKMEIAASLVEATLVHNNFSHLFELLLINHNQDSNDLSYHFIFSLENSSLTHLSDIGTLFFSTKYLDFFNTFLLFSKLDNCSNDLVKFNLPNKDEKENVVTRYSQLANRVINDPRFDLSANADFIIDTTIRHQQWNLAAGMIARNTLSKLSLFGLGHKDHGSILSIVPCELLFYMGSHLVEILIHEAIARENMRNQDTSTELEYSSDTEIEEVEMMSDDEEIGSPVYRR